MSEYPNDTRWATRDLLSRTPLFAGLAADASDELLAASQLLRLPAHHFLYHAGDPVREAHVLVSGSIKRSTTLAGEARQVLEVVQPAQLLAPGEIFGAGFYASSAETLGACIIVAIDIRRLHALVRSDPGLSWRLVQAMAQRQCAIEFDVSGFNYGFTGTQRILNYLIELAGGRPALAGETTVTLQTSKKIIASRIGMTPETLSRSLRQLSDSGVIFVEGRKVHIQNAALVHGQAAEANPAAGFSRQAHDVARRSGRSLPPGALINLCGRQRMLSQRLATAWALIAGEIATAPARVRLHKAEAEFARNLARLQKLELPAGLDTALAALAEAWPRYRSALAEPAVEQAAAPAVLALSEAVLEYADRLTALAETAAQRPEAHPVNIAGRNRMLSQRIAKFFLFRQWSPDDAGITAALESSCREFECNLAELRQAGAQGPELGAQLGEVAAQWAKFQRALQPDLGHASPARHALVMLAAGERLLRHVDTTVKLYERRAG